jgi:predicted deacylase
MISARKIQAGLLLAGLLVLPAWAQSIKTPAEESGYTKYTQNEEVARFLQAVAGSAREAKVQVIGKTLDAKDFPAASLYLCVITDEGVNSPGALKRSKPTVLIMASQHGNEQSAKEAALQVIRDLALGEMKPLLKQLNFLIIPQANPYGNFVNRRQNEQNLDLNRDHVKLESPETRAIHRVFRAWMPEVTLDLHEKGDDYYRVSTGCVSNFNIHESLQRYSREKIFPAIEKKVVADGYTWHEYLISESVGSTQAAGVPDRARAGQPREILMRYSTTDLNDGRNSPGIYETLSFIQECSSRHDLPTLQERTRWQYSGIRGLVEAVAKDGRQVLSLVRGRRADLLREARRPAPDRLVHLKMEYVRDPKEPELTLKAFERQAGPAQGGAQEPEVVTQVVKNWLPKVESRLAVPRPQGYIIPAEHQGVIKTLLDHGISVETFTRETAIGVEDYRVKEFVPAREDYLAPENIEVEKQQTKATVRKGDFYVPVAQPAANLIPCLLEPQSEYGLIRYQMYKLAPPKGSVFPILRLAKGKLPVSPYRAPAATQ